MFVTSFCAARRCSTSLTAARRPGSLGLPVLDWIRTCSPAVLGKLSLTICWERAASPTTPSSSDGMVFVPMLPPMKVAMITKASQPNTAFLRCCALQRPAREARFCFCTGESPSGGSGTSGTTPGGGPHSEGVALSERVAVCHRAKVRLALRAAVELAPERLLRRLRHARLEDRHQHLGGQRAQLLEGGEHGRPVGLRLPVAVERLPDPVEEELHERGGDAVGLAGDVLDDVERLLERNAEADQRLARAHERRARDLVAPLPQRHDDAELLGAPELPLVTAGEALRELGGLDDLGPLVLERGEDRAGELERVLGVAPGPLDE